MQKDRLKHLFHRAVFFVLRYTAARFIKRRMRYSYEKKKGPNAPSIIISNHNTDLDPVLVAMSYSKHMYFLASEHAFRKGFVSKLLEFAFSPISINKSKVDASAIAGMLRKLRAGANVCLFAEGDRSFNGVTGQIPKSTGKLVKTSNADLITFRLEGGYFTSPRWAKNNRQGRMTGRQVNRYTAEELKAMSVAEINNAIERDIFEDAYERQKANLTRYRGKLLAEDIETALYLCPICGKLGTIRSEGNRFFCVCGLDGVYTETGLLIGDSLPYSTITEWDVWQSEKLESIVVDADDGFISTDDMQTLYLVGPGSESGRTLVSTGIMGISRDAFHCAGYDFPIDHITKMAIAGQMTLLFSIKSGDSYEVHSDAPRSALKYREIFRILTDNT